MDLTKIEQLIQIVEKSSLTEFTIEENDLKITMSKQVQGGVVVAGAPVVAPGATVQAPVAEQEAAEEEVFITSPIVATFYSASAPEVPAFVKVGDVVKAGETVCLLEAMKLMNEIEAEFDCEIEAILVSNEQKVEYGQPLFRVKKL